MPKLRNMLGETGTLEIPVPGDEPLMVTYRRGAMTPRLQSKLVLAQQAASGDGSALASGEALMTMCEVYAALVDSWNLTDDSGAVIGTDADSLADVDLGILTMVMQAIGKEINPDPLKDSDSSNGSSPTVVLEPLPITTAS